MIRSIWLAWIQARLSVSLKTAFTTSASATWSSAKVRVFSFQFILLLLLLCMHAFITCTHSVMILNQRHWQSLDSMVRALMGYLKRWVFSHGVWRCQAPRSASATNLRRQLHWLPIRQRITYKIAVITYKTRSTGTPAYLSHLINDYLPSRGTPAYLSHLIND